MSERASEGGWEVGSLDRAGRPRASEMNSPKIEGFRRTRGTNAGGFEGMATGPNNWHFELTHTEVRGQHSLVRNVELTCWNARRQGVKLPWSVESVRRVNSGSWIVDSG